MEESQNCLRRDHSQLQLLPNGTIKKKDKEERGACQGVIPPPRPLKASTVVL